MKMVRHCSPQGQVAHRGRKALDVCLVLVLAVIVRCALQCQLSAALALLPELPKTYLYIVRHGAVIPPGSRAGAMYGGADVALSQKGRLEARAAAEFLRVEAPHLDAIYASNLSRAIFGAKLIAEGRDVEVLTDARFTEINRGVWVGLTRDEIAERFPDHLEQVGSLSSFANNPEFSGHCGEGYRAVGRRVLAARDDLLQRHTGQTLCLVCHNWVTAALVGSALGIEAEEWHTLKIPTASVSLVEYSFARKWTGGTVLKQRVIFVGKSPPEYTDGRLDENGGAALPSKG